MKKSPVVLCILDGLGIRTLKRGNALKIAKTPNIDSLTKNYPNATLTTHGSSVGLPDGQMGNSEVGHLNIGSGRVIKAMLPRIDEAIELADRILRTNKCDFVAIGRKFLLDPNWLQKSNMRNKFFIPSQYNRG